LKYANARESISIYANIGNVYTGLKLFDSAFYFYQKAFDQIRPGLNENGLIDKMIEFTLNNYAEYVVALVLDKADANLILYKEKGGETQLKVCLDAYRTADLIMDKLKQGQFEIQSKLSWRKNIRRLYEHAIEASWLDKNTEQGFYFFEKSRAVLLDDQLKQDRLMQNGESLEQFQLKTRINHLEKELDTMNPQSDRYSLVQAEIIGKKEEQEHLLSEIKSKDPLFTARNPDADSMNVRVIQDIILKDHSALMEIFNGDSAVYMLVITNKESSLTKVNKKSFDSLSGSFLFFLSDPAALNSHFPQFTEISGRLYQLIFPATPLPAGRVIISPDGNFFPFEALITSRGKNVAYMLKDYSISYTYSARFLTGHFSNGTHKPGSDFMGVAPVNYAPYLKLASLTGSDISLRNIEYFFNKGYITVNAAASKSNFLSNFTGYRIVQIYSHASFAGLSGKPEIYFADSSLALSELFSRERPVARLIVLSACETALGKDYRGEGVFSFSREFAALGIPASVSNLWSVDNEATYRITELFYANISAGMPTDRALQQAKLKYIKESSREKALPFYWAAPILTGKTEVIKTKTGYPIQEIIIILGIAGVFTWAGFRSGFFKPRKPKSS
jgi:hypothetical protein